MNYQAILLAVGMLTLAACGSGGREMPVEAAVIRPDKVMDFNLLYGKNCAGCHGPDGKGGAAIALADPVYLAISDDAIITRVTANGVSGTSMPPFAQRSGGSLTDDQVKVITGGIRSRWAKPDALRDTNPPPYAADSPGDPTRGAEVYGVYCSRCHGADGHKGETASSIVEASYLALVSDQSLRTTVIAGRPEMGAPDWRGNVPGRPMSSQEVSDVVAWLAAHRPQGGNR